MGIVEQEGDLVGVGVEKAFSWVTFRVKRIKIFIGAAANPVNVSEGGRAGNFAEWEGGSDVSSVGAPIRG